MQTVNFFLISVAFLLAAFGALLEKFPVAALAVAFVGTWVSVWYIVLDERTKQLIKAGEAALQVYEQLLSACSDIEEVRIVQRVERPSAGALTYSKIFKIIELSIALVFLAGALYAGSVEWSWFPGESIVASPPVLHFRSTRDRAQPFAAWQRGFPGSLKLENGCPGIAVVTGSSPRWSVTPISRGKCELTVYGEKRTVSVKVEVRR